MYGKHVDRETRIVLEGKHNVQDARANKHTCPTPRRKATVILLQEGNLLYSLSYSAFWALELERRLYESTSVYKIEKENKSNKKEIQNEHKIKKIIKINGKPKKNNPPKTPQKKQRKQRQQQQQQSEQMEEGKGRKIGNKDTKGAETMKQITESDVISWTSTHRRFVPKNKMHNVIWTKFTVICNENKIQNVSNV